MAFDFKEGDWLEYGQWTIIKVMGVGGLEFLGHVFIPCPKSPGKYLYVKQDRVSRNLVQDFFTNAEAIRQMEDLLSCQK